MKDPGYWFLRTVTKSKTKKNDSSSCVYTLPRNVKLERFTLQSCRDGREMCQKRKARAKLFCFLKIVYFERSRCLRWYLTFPNHDNFELTTQYSCFLITGENLALWKKLKKRGLVTNTPPSFWRSPKSHEKKLWRRCWSWTNCTVNGSSIFMTLTKDPKRW